MLLYRWNEHVLESSVLNKYLTYTESPGPNPTQIVGQELELGEQM